MTVQFNTEEVTLLRNAKIIEQKNKLLLRLIEVLSHFGHDLMDEFSDSYALSPPAKVNRGEHYRAYPYLVMDYPRLFGKKDVFAFRSLFWWGHFFSCTLHLKGDFLRDFGDSVDKMLRELEDSPYQLRISDSGNEWNHDALSEEYTDLKDYQFNFQKLLEKQAFFKICIILPISKINQLDTFLSHSKNALLRPLQ